MTAASLPAALRAAAEGLYALEAATGLVIATAPGWPPMTSPGITQTGEYARAEVGSGHLLC